MGTLFLQKKGVQPTISIAIGFHLHNACIGTYFQRVIGNGSTKLNTEEGFDSLCSQPFLFELACHTM
jgi:hypothetical protein